MVITMSDQAAFEKLMAQEQQECVDEKALANDLGCGPISIDRKITCDGKSFDLIISMKCGDISVSESLNFEIGYTCAEKYLEHIMTLLFCRLTDDLIDRLVLKKTKLCRDIEEVVSVIKGLY